jgi:uncharacterized cysteine cluster protein YcgN (CxxCxxCC family)
MSAPEEPPDWEAICKQCGECCFEKKIDARGRIITTRIPCRFLDIHTRHCRVYEHRFKLEEDCIKLTPENVAELEWLPQGCAYREWLQEQNS